MQNGNVPHESRLAEFSKGLKATYERKNPKSAAHYARACDSLPGGNTRSTLWHAPFPMTFESGRDCYVTSLDGREYLDFVSEYTAGMYGHSHPKIQEAVLEAMRSGINLGGHNLKEVELAEHIVARFKSIELVRFCNSGTEANNFALGLARAYTRRSQVLVFGEGYHGGTLSFAHKHNPLNVPYDFVFGIYNDIAATKEVISNNVAAILVEPMQFAGGMIPAQQDFIHFLRHTASEIGAVLIFDEVVSSRLHYGGLQEHFGIYPDMTTLGKYLAGGFSFGAFGGRREIMGLLDPRLSPDHGGLSQPGTYNNNIFSMTAGVAASKLVTPESISSMNSLGENLRTRLQSSLDEHHITSIYPTGLGSLTGLHFSGPDSELLQDAFYFYMLDHGIYLGKRGFIGLNLVHKEHHIEQILMAIREFFAKVKNLRG